MGELLRDRSDMVLSMTVDLPPLTLMQSRGQLQMELALLISLLRIFLFHSEHPPHLSRPQHGEPQTPPQQWHAQTKGCQPPQHRRLGPPLVERAGSVSPVQFIVEVNTQVLVHPHPRC